MQKLKNFCIKNKMYLGLGVISLLLFFCEVWAPLQWISSIAIVLFALICSVKQLFYFSFYLFAFTGIGYQFVMGITTCLIAMVVKYFIQVAKSEKQIYRRPIILSAIILIVWSCISYQKSFDGYAMGGMIVYVISMAYILFVYHKEVNISKCFTYSLVAFVISFGFAMLSRVFPNFNQEIIHFDLTYYRLKLFTLHMNNLAIHMMFQIAFSIYSLFNRKRKVWIDVFAILFSLYVGLATKSKAFLLIMCVFVLYAIICLIAKFKKKSIIYIAIMAAILALAVIFGWEYLRKIIDRFFTYVGYFENREFLNILTTGRADIWEFYINDWKSSPSKIFFGIGIFSADPYHYGTHNVALFLLHRFGLVGIVLIAGLIYYYFKEGLNAGEKLSLNLYSCLILIAWCLISLEETVLSDQFILYLYFGLTLLLKDKHHGIEDDEKVTNKTETFKSNGKSVIDEIKETIQEKQSQKQINKKLNNKKE